MEIWNKCWAYVEEQERIILLVLRYKCMEPKIYNLNIIIELMWWVSKKSRIIQVKSRSKVVLFVGLQDKVPNFVAKLY